MKYRILERIVDEASVYQVQGGLDDTGYKNVAGPFTTAEAAYSAIRQLKYDAGQYIERVFDYDI